jgi:hypothetical protein
MGHFPNKICFRWGRHKPQNIDLEEFVPLVGEVP